MTLDAFRRALSDSTPPSGLSKPLEALWRAARDEWDDAHMLAQAAQGQDAAWVHAHLHRVEGDLANAAGWYRRAGKPVCDAPLDREWEEITRSLLSDVG